MKTMICVMCETEIKKINDMYYHALKKTDPEEAEVEVPMHKVCFREYWQLRSDALMSKLKLDEIEEKIMARAINARREYRNFIHPARRPLHRVTIDDDGVKPVPENPADERDGSPTYETRIDECGTRITTLTGGPSNVRMKF